MKKILIALVVLLAVLIIVVAVQPSKYAVTRSASMAAPAAIVFGHVNDFHKWEAWSPWAKMDPNQKTTISGSEAGTGATYTWEGNKNVGKGKMTIIESKMNELIVVKLEFTEPFVSEAENRFTFTSAGENTTVSWAMHGESDFVGKAFGMFMNRDEMLGSEFEKGLASMKAIVEKDAQEEAEAAAAAAQLAADSAADAGTADAGTADGGTADGGTADGGTADGGTQANGNQGNAETKDTPAAIPE